MMDVVWLKNMKEGLEPQVWHESVGWLMTMRNSLGNYMFPSQGGDKIVARLKVNPADEGLTFNELVEKYKP
jgi:hypothetical protein